MKATGEVMSICNNFEGALMKAIRSLEQHVDSLMSYDFSHLSKDELIEELHIVDDMRIWRIAEAIRQGISYDEIHEITKIDVWFIDKLAILVEMEQALQAKELDEDLLREAKRLEFPDYLVAKLAGKTEEEVKALRKQYDITAAYKMVDTCAAEFAATTPYYYSVYGGENEAVETNDRKKVLVLGSGRSVSDRVSSLTSAPYIVPGHSRKRAMRPSSSTTTRRPSAPTSISQINCISSR